MEHGFQMIIRHGILGATADARVQLKDTCKNRLASDPDPHRHNHARLMQRVLGGRGLA